MDRGSRPAGLADPHEGQAHPAPPGRDRRRSPSTRPGASSSPGATFPRQTWCSGSSPTRPRYSHQPQPLARTSTQCRQTASPASTHKATGLGANTSLTSARRREHQASSHAAWHARHRRLHACNQRQRTSPASQPTTSNTPTEVPAATRRVSGPGLISLDALAATAHPRPRIRPVRSRRVARQSATRIPPSGGRPGRATPSTARHSNSRPRRRTT